MSFKGKFNIIQNSPFVSDIFFEAYNERTLPPPVSDVRITEDSDIRITEDGEQRITE